MSEEDNRECNSDSEGVDLTGEHQSPQQRQATFLTYRSLSEWVMWTQPLAMTMQRGRMSGVTEEVMVVDYISRNS